MAINKVVIGENVIMDISADTLEEASSLPQNVTAHNKNGELITGIATKQSTETIYISDIEQTPPFLRGPLYVLPECTYTVDIDPDERNKLISGNIKKGTTLFGVSGSSTVVDVSSASKDLSSSDIKGGKSAYDGNGNIIAGTYSEPVEYSIGGSLAVGTATKYYVKRNINAVNDCAFATHPNYKNGFYYIQQYDIPDTVTTIGESSFYYNQSLNSISNLSNVTSIGNNAFTSCKNLSSISAGNVTTIGNSAFSSCTNLSSIDISNVTTLGNSVFNSCSMLTSINVSNANTIGSGAFYKCENLTNIQVKNGVKITPYSDSYECKIATINGHLYYQKGKASNTIYRDNTTTVAGILSSDTPSFTDTYGVTFSLVTSNNDENEENAYEFTITW